MADVGGETGKNYRGLAAAVITQALNDLETHIKGWRSAEKNGNKMMMNSHMIDCRSIHRFMTEDNIYFALLDLDGKQVLQMFLRKKGMTATFRKIERSFHEQGTLNRSADR